MIFAPLGAEEQIRFDLPAIALPFSRACVSTNQKEY
jgi:hypothetical protein